MRIGVGVLNADEVLNLKKNGYLLLKSYKCEATTLEVASSLAKIVTVGDLVPETGISTVHKVIPKNKAETNAHSYSGIYGLGAFPFHTDLAHWSVPPRFIVLRCVEGDDSVATLILTPQHIQKLKKWLPLSKALFSPRRNIATHCAVILPMMFAVDGVNYIRWDKDFLNPVNESGRVVRDGIENALKNADSPAAITLSSPGDTLILDNWRCIHSRTSVPDGSKRVIERVYLEGDLQ